MAQFRTPLSKVRGLGSARDGTGHFWRTRVTSVALVPLTLFFLWLVAHLAGAGFAEARATLANPFVAIGLAGFLLVGIYHMSLGMQEVILDYIHAEGSKFGLLMLNIFFCAALGGIVTLALAMIVFGG